MKKNTDVVVLLSSYNGEKFIEEQVKSVLGQTGVAVRLVIRDDGSTDETLVLLEQLACRYHNIQFSVGQNVGVVRSFFTMLAHADPNAEYFAFADQDDVWLPEKLSNALSLLNSCENGEPLMYCARVEYVDAALGHLGFSPIYDAKKIGFGNALVQNIATGCTIVLNRAAREKILSKLPEKCLIHDWWMYMVVSAFGKVLYDQRPCMKYRQHGGNTIGASASFMERQKRRARRFFEFTEATKASTQVREFHRLFCGELDAPRKMLIEQILRLNTGCFSRLRLALSRNYWRQSFFDEILLRLVILSGRF